MRKHVLLLLALVLFLGSPTVLAQTVVRATLSGGEEVPKVATAANGEAIFVISADKSSIEYQLIVRNIGTEITASHIHLGPQGGNGPVILFLYDSRTRGPFTGSVTGILTAADLITNADAGLTTFAVAVDNLIRGNTYTNVHTTKERAGEVRGQNLAVVDPR